MEIILIIGIFGILAFLIFDKFLNKKGNFSDEKKQETEELKIKNENLGKENLELKIKNENLEQKNGENNQKILNFEKEISTNSEKGRNLFIQNQNLEKKIGILEEENKKSHQKIAKFESEEEKKQKDFEKKIEELENSRKSLEDEKLRIRREDENKLAEIEKNRDRIWAEHEVSAILKMKEICIKPEYSFDFYENTNLPDSFDGKFKPDFLIDFLGQYVIFDAKISKSASIQNYINDQVKSTAKKIKSSTNSNEIYSTIFFVIPQIDFEKMNKIAFYEDGFNFFVITPEFFEIVLMSFKKISIYENLEKIDPQERENIVNILAAYDQHISHRNAIDILSAIQGVKIGKLKENLGEGMLEEIDQKKSKIRLETFKPTELQKFIKDPSHQVEEIKKMIEPKKAEIGKDEIEQISII